MNTGFYKDLDTNFEHALELSEKDFSHDELLDLLRQGNIPQKQIAALKLDCVLNQKEAQILVDNLTGCDGKIREAVALRINQILNVTPECARFFTQANIFADASIDINANICRLAIDSAAILVQDREFAQIYRTWVLSFIQEAFVELDKFIFRDKKYVINKQLFKLYWSLEALKLFVSELSSDILLPILDRTSQEREYTIREKSAQIIKICANGEYDQIKNRLANDENYYVREALNH